MTALLFIYLLFSKRQRIILTRFDSLHILPQQNKGDKLRKALQQHSSLGLPNQHQRTGNKGAEQRRIKHQRMRRAG